VVLGEVLTCGYAENRYLTQVLTGLPSLLECFRRSEGVFSLLDTGALILNCKALTCGYAGNRYSSRDGRCVE
jgi:hypothetical protein